MLQCRDERVFFTKMVILWKNFKSYFDWGHIKTYFLHWNDVILPINFSSQCHISGIKYFYGKPDIWLDFHTMQDFWSQKVQGPSVYLYALLCVQVLKFNYLMKKLYLPLFFFDPKKFRISLAWTYFNEFLESK